VAGALDASTTPTIPAAPRARGGAGHGSPAGPVGVIGAGQLARMLCEAASALAVPVVVLAEHADDSAALVSPRVVLGSPKDREALRVLFGQVEVVTFDHEQVDLDLLSSFDSAPPMRPGLATLGMAVDKAEMRRRLRSAGIPVPAFHAIDAGGPERALAGVEAFAATHGWPVVLKAARGGYDGKGVWTAEGPDEARAVCERAAAGATPLLVEELVGIDTELAVVVARRPGGDSAAWPPVETAQETGVCREVSFPGELDTDVAARATALARAVADVAGAVGVLAVEMFASAGRLLVNEVAARPHNSAHWTIEGSTTSQFENHLRAVLDLPLGDTTPLAPHVASVNVFGADADGGSVVRMASALEVTGAHVHLYGKAPRPGRKLGHVTVCGEDADDVRARAWAAARALGTPVPSRTRAPASTRAPGGGGR
jgi:5-(carboxyamino)imidazole ribonucleotide synthase